MNKKNKPLKIEESIKVAKNIFDKENSIYNDNQDLFWNISNLISNPSNNKVVSRSLLDTKFRIGKKKISYYENNNDTYKYGVYIIPKNEKLVKGGEEDIIFKYLIYRIKIDSNTIEYITDSNSFDKILPKYYGNNTSLDYSSITNNIFSKIQNEKELKIYEIHGYVKNETVKKLRVRFYSDSNFDIISDVKKNFLRNWQEELELMDIGFSKGKKTFKIKFRRMSQNMLRIQLNKRSSLYYELSNLFGIEDGTILFKENNEITLINDLFREKTVNWYLETINKDILNRYSKFMELDQNNVAVLKKDNIFNKLNQILKEFGYIIEPLPLTKNDFSIISKKGKKSEFFRVKDNNGKIVQNILIDHNQYYSEGENLFKKYFMLIPFLILDYRKNNSIILDNNSKYIISTGLLLKALLKEDKDLIKSLFINAEIQEIRKDSLEKYGSIAREIANNLEEYNKKLEGNSQQKGQFLEILSLCLLARIFNIERIGGCLNEDGVFSIDKEKIHYDVKNIKGNLIGSETNSENAIKCIEYIEKSNIEHYVYILKNEDLKSSFEEIYPLIKEKLNEKNINCSVSGISIEGICKLYDICFQDGPLNKIDFNKVGELFKSNKFITVNDISEESLVNSLN